MDLIKILNDFKWYDADDSEKHISASSFSKESLELWLMVKKYPDNPFRLNDATVGSICHLGMEHIVKQTPEYKRGHLLLEQRIIKHFNGWKISGKPDMVDVQNQVIYDYKTGKNYSKKMVDKEGKYHSYAIQCAVYNWLLNGGYTAKLLWLMKDSKAVEGEPVIFEQNIEIMSLEETEKYIADTLMLMDNFTDTPPEQCKDLWIRKTKKGTLPTKCLFYCSKSNSCPKHKPSAIQSISAW